MTDDQLAKTETQLAKTYRQPAKSDAQLALPSAQLLETKRIVSGIGINLGDAAEDFLPISFRKRLDDIQFEVGASAQKAPEVKF
jgi:hypothetical protein